MLEGAGSLVLNAMSIPRRAENTQNPVGEQIWLAPVPQGPVRRLTPVNLPSRATSSGSSPRISTVPSNSWWTI